MDKQNKTPTRDDYYRTAISRGASDEVAGKIADGIIEARERRKKDLPGWESLCHRIPKIMRRRSVHLYNAAGMSCPSDDIEDQARSGLQAVLSYGVLIGMVLAENGYLISDAERKASQQNMPDIWKWIDLLNDEQKDNLQNND